MNLLIEDLLNISHRRANKFLKISQKQKVRRVSTDSRTIGKGDVFVALRGDKFNGHEFLEEVKLKGAIAAIVDTKWFERNTAFQLPCIVVTNTLNAYGELARNYRRKFSIPILIVAGSNGKTTTKDLLAHTLGTSFNVLKTDANLNNQIGLPRMLLNLKKAHDLAVLEIGTNHPGEIAWLTKVAEPTHALVTNIGREHLEFFKNIDGVAREELSSLFITEELGGFGFINCDDPLIRPIQKLFEEWSITYGTTPKADVVAGSLGFDTKGKHQIEVRLGKSKFTVKTQILADYAPNMVAAATAVALHFGVKKARLKEALTSYAPHSKRMEVIRTSNGITIINDAYNANPESFASALSTLDRMRTKGKKYVAAGDMFELGNASALEHRNLGKLMQQYSFNKFFLTGDDMKHAYNSLRRSKVPTIYASKKEILDTIQETVTRGDILLVKGSRGMRMEEIVDALRK
jgi:UDP-N-acetylmuramoyl-tripeptide--D-alanyl-D-alanine ligase